MAAPVSDRLTNNTFSILLVKFGQKYRNEQKGWVVLQVHENVN